MAEVAAGLLAAEQVISTGVEAAVAVAAARPTKPPKASLTQLSSTTGHIPGRAHHTVTVIGNKAYIFGGEQENGNLCSPDVQVVTIPGPKDEPHGFESQHESYPAFPVKDAATNQTLVPSPRGRHAACAKGTAMIIHGGYGADHAPLADDEEGACLWLWDTGSLSWSRMSGATQIGKTLKPRFGHHVFCDERQDFLLLHGGRTVAEKDIPASTETWMFNFTDPERVWTEMPSSPGVAMGAAYVDATLYIVSQDGDGTGNGREEMGGAVHFLRLGATARDREYPDGLVWQTVKFPANPLVPGPQPRPGSALVPVDQGLGRKFLLYLFGRRTGAKADKKDGESLYMGDIWSLQLPTHGPTPAAAKDTVRDRLPGRDSGEFSWAEVEIVPEEENEVEGKAHPGTRSCFGADVCVDGKGVFVWGGLDEKSEKQADGWLVKSV